MKTPTKPTQALHQVEESWSPYERLPGAGRSVLRRLWARLGFSRGAATTLRYEADMLLLRMWCFFNPAHRSKVKRLRGLRQLRLHIGCGSVVLPGWVNLDCYPPKPQENAEILVLDLRKGLPLSGGSVSAVYSEHFFEHLPFEVVQDVIVPDCYRMLEPGGYIRVGVPDGGYIVTNYLATKTNSADDLYTQQLRGRTPMQMLNDMTHAFTHHYLWDYETLRMVFEKAGFTELRHARPHDSEVSHFQDLDRTDPWRMRFTLYIEGRRPTAASS